MKMSFRLRTLFLLVSISAIALAWHVKNERKRIADEVEAIWDYEAVSEPNRLLSKGRLEQAIHAHIVLDATLRREAIPFSAIPGYHSARSQMKAAAEENPEIVDLAYAALKDDGERMISEFEAQLRKGTDESIVRVNLKRLERYLESFLIEPSQLHGYKSLKRRL